MSSKLVPANPSEVMVIRNITPRVVTLSVPFLRAGLIKIGGRGTIVKLTSGALAVFSPVALTPEVKVKLTELGGKLSYIVAPDIAHHLFVSQWAAEFPDAKIIGPEGLPEKRAKTKGDPMIGNEAFFFVFKGGEAAKKEARISDEFDADFDYEYVDAHPNKELVFFFRPDRVLIEADLMFNLPAVEQYSRVPEAERAQSLIARWFPSVQSTQGDAKGQKRFLWYLLSSQNRSGFNESVQRINKWDFTTVIPCHGDTIEGDGKEVFEKVFEWHLQGHK